MSTAQDLIAHYAKVRARLRTAPAAITTKTPQARRFAPSDLRAAFAEYVPARHAFDCVRHHDEPQIDGPQPAPGRTAPSVARSIATVQAVVCAHFAVAHLDLVSARRSRRFVHPRQIAMYLCCRMTARSLAEIGRQFGARDHSTTWHAARRVERLMETSPELCAELGVLQEKIAEAP